MKKIMFPLLMLISLLNVISCNKPDPEPELPTGENTVYYYLNGNLNIPNGYTCCGGTKINPIRVFNCDSPNNSIKLNISRDYHTHLDIFIKDGIQNEGEIILNQGSYGNCENDYSYGYYFYSEWFSDYTFFTANNSGIINISYLSDDKKKIIGTFNLDLYEDNGSVTKITNGHFNINLDTL